MNPKHKTVVKLIGGGIGALIVGIVLMFGATKVVYPAISQLVGLSVAQSATLWNNVKDASVGDNLTSGILAIGLMLYDEANLNFDRARGDTANGLDVDVTRISGNITPADGYANPTTANQMWSLTGLFNGTTWDRWRGQVSPIQSHTLFNSVNNGTNGNTLVVTVAGAASTRVHLYDLTAFCFPNGSTSMTISDGTTLYDTGSGGIPGNTMRFVKNWSPALTAATAATLTITVATCGASSLPSVTIQADRF